MSKVRTICVDTLTGIQNEMYMTSSKKPGHDAWADYGKGVWQLISDLQSRGFEIVLILGEPGTGKSSGMRTLPHNTNIWFNADNKNPVWIGGKEEYGKKGNPRMPYHVVPNTYKDITDHIDQGLEKGMFEEERFAILTGHTEDYKSGLENKKRLLNYLQENNEALYQTTSAIRDIVFITFLFSFLIIEPIIKQYKIDKSLE